MAAVFTNAAISLACLFLLPFEGMFLFVDSSILCEELGLSGVAGSDMEGSIGLESALSLPSISDSNK